MKTGDIKNELYGARDDAANYLDMGAETTKVLGRVHGEMIRYLIILERAEADPEIWAKLTACTGIATINGYRHAIELANKELK
jgi:hypothetical protein